MREIILTFLLLFSAASPAFSHDSNASRADIGIDEKLGTALPDGLMFSDEQGIRKDLKSMIDKPTIIAPVYFGCMHTCPMLLSGLATALGNLDLVTPGKDFNVMALSFDEHDTPTIALDRKKNYVKAIGKPFPDAAWKFMTGDAESIKRFTNAIGFKFQRDSEHDFSHPVVLVVLAPGGKVVRYIEGVSFLPFEVTMALTEAAEGRIGSPARKAMMFCFSYDPLKKTYVFNILKITGIAMVLFVGGFLAWLLMSSKKSNRNSP
jgi:protein SCO1/2